MFNKFWFDIPSKTTLTFLISSFLAASRVCMMQTFEVMLLSSKDTMSLNSVHYISHFNSMQSTVEERSKIEWRNHNLRNKICCLTKNFPLFKKNIHSILLVKKILQNYIQTTSYKNNNIFNLLSSESDSSTRSLVINIVDLKDQISCSQKTFWNINSCIQGIYIVNNDSLLHNIISFRLIIIKMNLQLLFILYTLSFSYKFLYKKITKSGLQLMRFKSNTCCPKSQISQKNVLLRL